MARFHDTLSSLGVGEDGISVAYPETFTDDISAAYEEDMGGASAKIAVLEADLAAANQTINELKAHNYDLLTQVPSVVTPEEGTEDEEENPESSEDDEPDDLDKVFSN
jgi:hypothetical protein